MSFLVLIALFCVIPIGIFNWVSWIDPEAKFLFDIKGELLEKSPRLYTMQWVIWGTMGLLAVAFWINANALKQDIKTIDANAEIEPTAEAPPAPLRLAEVEPIDIAIAYFEQQGYSKVRGFNGTHDQSLLLYAKHARSESGLYRREGAIIYPGGDSAKISVGILHESDSWEYGSEHRIQRSRMGRAVKIRTALNNPLLKNLVLRNHHILTVGLASKEGRETNFLDNAKLSYARGYNAGYAVWELGWKDAERIYPLTMGVARIEASGEFEALQRSVLIVGVNATVETLASDIITATMLLTDPALVDLKNYTKPVDEPFPVQEISAGDGPIDAKDVPLTEGSRVSYPSLVLPPNEDAN